jgi:HSP20 family protein
MASPTRSAPIARAIRWDPFRELEELQRRTEELVESAVAGAEVERLWTPLVDVEETEDAWIVEAEVPGAKRKDIKVELQDSQLAISGEIKERERAGIVRRRTRRRGAFEYRVTLPGDADPEGVDANLHDGVLTVRVPKAKKSQTRQIEIKSDGRG